MRKLKTLLIVSLVILFTSCSSNDVEPIVLTEESFSLELSTIGFFATDNIVAEINSEFTFLTITATNRERVFTVQIGNESADAPVLTEGSYSVNANGELIANIIYDEGANRIRTESGLFRRIDIVNIDIDSGIISGTFSGFLSDGTNDTAELTNGQFTGVFFSVEE